MANSSNEGQNEALFLAVAQGDVDATVRLIEEGGQVNCYSSLGMTPLMLAAQQGHLALVYALLEKGADVEWLDMSGQTALLLAAQEGHVDVVTALVSKGADLNYVEPLEGWSALTVAVQSGHLEVVTVLAKHGAYLDFTDSKNNWTALIWAVLRGDFPIVKALLDLGADVDSVDKDKRTALMFAAQEGHIGMVEALLDKEANLGCTDSNGWTALLFAAREGHLNVVNALIERDAMLDHNDVSGQSALMLAAQRGHLSVVTRCLDMGANLDSADKIDWTALMLAAERGQMDVVTTLIDKGANLDQAAKGSGKTAEDLARDSGHTNVAEVIKQERLIQAMRKLSKDRGDSVPIKLFALGKAYAGKTESLKSLFYEDKKFNEMFDDAEKYNESQMNEKYKTRTMGINVYHVKIGEQRMSVFDCGGLDNYYLLHSLFTKVDNSIILVVFSLTRDDESLKDEHEIKTELKQQIAFIKSEVNFSACKSMDNVLLIGTHTDLLKNQQQVDSCHVMMEVIRKELGEEEKFNFPFYKLVNAKARGNEDIAKVFNEIRVQSEAIAKQLDAKKRQVPSLCYAACDRLQKHAKEKELTVLNWETVFNQVRDEAMQFAKLEVNNKMVFEMCQWMDSFGMLLLSQPEDVSKEKLYEDPNKLFVIPDLNWFFSKFLGVIFSPAGYLKHRSVCKKGYVSLKDLETAFNGFKLAREQIVAILKQYKVVCDSISTDGELLIPGALSSDKKPEWSCCGKEFKIIVGRRCEMNGLPFSIGTMPGILSELGQIWYPRNMEFFQSGVFIYHNIFSILVEMVDLHTAIEVRIGALEADMKNKNEEDTLESIEKLMDTIFHKVVCGTAESRNQGGNMKTYALSSCWLRSLSSEKPLTTSYFYDFQFLEDTFLSGANAVRHHFDRNVKDDMKFLLSPSKLKELKPVVELCRKRVKRSDEEEGMYFKDTPSEILKI